MYFAKFLSELLLPPTNLILLMVLGLLLKNKFPRVAGGLVITGIGGLYLLSMPLFTMLLVAPLQNITPLTEQQIQLDKSEAIVVLAAGRRMNAREFGGSDTVPPLGLERLRYAAWLKRRTHLPLVLSGGKYKKEYLLSEAQLMRDVLQKEFLVEVNFMEQESRNTYENALFTANLLKDIGVTEIFLVTHAWHMKRAVAAFEQQGISVIPAPTAFYDIESTSIGPNDFFPRARSLLMSYYAMHEYLGILWYKVFY
ncbi:MAG: YdcF family protein [Thiohalomonadales bacterium]